MTVTNSSSRLLPPTPYEPEAFERMGVVQSWEKYHEVLTWGKGQCLALLDDGCDLTAAEWKVELPWGRKVKATANTVEGHDDPSPVGPAYHGTTVGFPSSLNFEGRRGVAYNNQVAHVRCVTIVHLVQDESETISAALRWVWNHRESCGITAVNLAPLDDQRHRQSWPTVIDPVLKDLREAGIWVSAPCGNNGFTDGVSWPAASLFCFAVGATDPVSGRPHLDRFENTDIVVPATATSSSNAILAGSAMVLREAIEKTGYPWSGLGATLPEAMLEIFRQTGQPAFDPTTGLTFREANLLNALDHVFA